MMSKHEAYNQAIKAHEDADAAFDAALKRQFGTKASRWDYPTSIYDADTLAAMNAKRAASDAQRAAWLAMREEA